MNVFERIEKELSVLESLGIRRSPADGEVRRRVLENARKAGVPFVDVSSNDYLGFASGDGIRRDRYWAVAGDAAATDISQNVSRETTAGRVVGTASEGSTGYGFEGASDSDRGNSGGDCELNERRGSGASRLLGGTFAEHELLESELARWVHQDAALVFSSGYAANVGLMSSLPEDGDVVFSDRMNHASIIDGCRLGKAKVVVYPHCDLDALRSELGVGGVKGRRWVVTETYFSMDGDGPNLTELRALCDEVGAGLIVDEAHAIGVFGTGGGGLSAAARIAPDVYVGAFGKAVGLSGAFVAGPTVLKEWLWNKARSFVFSTAITPTNAQRLLFHVKQIQGDDLRRARLMAQCEHVRGLISDLGYRLAPDSFGPIVPIMIGDNQQALALATYLRDRGILAYPIRPPTVPDGTARLRLTLTASLTNEAIDHLVQCLAQCAALLSTHRLPTHGNER